MVSRTTTFQRVRSKLALAAKADEKAIVFVEVSEHRIKRVAPLNYSIRYVFPPFVAVELPEPLAEAINAASNGSVSMYNPYRVGLSSMGQGKSLSVIVYGVK